MAKNAIIATTTVATPSRIKTVMSVIEVEWNELQRHPAGPAIPFIFSMAYARIPLKTPATVAVEKKRAGR